ncbi:hypothetical protein D3C76_1173970 [compost metagenome]
MQQLLVQSVSKMEAEIDRLRSLSGFIRKVLDENEHYGQEGTSFQVIQRDQLALTTWFETHMESELDARMLVQEGDTLPELFEADIHYVYEGDHRVLLCTEVHGVKGDIALPAGEYLSYQFTIHGEEDLEQHFSQFQAIADRRGLILHGSRILVEKSYLSLFTQESLYYELFARIEHNGSDAVDGDGKR